MPLTDLAIRAAAPGSKPYKLFDGSGLFLLVHPNGSRYWRMKYRMDGKERLLAIGVYPSVSLKEARAKRDDARRQVASGVDPVAAREAVKAHGSGTFEAVAREWLSRRRWVPSYACKVEAWLQNDVFPWLGGSPVDALAAPEFLAVARRVEARGAIESAHRILQNCGQVMRYAIATGRAIRNPVPDLRGALSPPIDRHHAAITDPADIGPILLAIDGYKGDAATRAMIQLAPLVFVRPGELRHAEWGEVDLDQAVWSIPAGKMKMRQAHMVPLSNQAVAILRDLCPPTAGGYVFPSPRDSNRPTSDNTLNAALRRMGFDRDTMTAHGFRAMARTVLDEVLGFRPDYIEHQLAHSVRDPNGRAYNRTAHLTARREMMQSWADYLDDLRLKTKKDATPKGGVSRLD